MTAVTALSVCVVGERGRRWALPIEVMAEVADLEAPLPLPRCRPEIIGLGSLRGQALAVVDLGALLGGAPPRPAAALTVAVVRLPGVSAGLAVDRVEAVVELDPLAIAPRMTGDPAACTGRLAGNPPALLISAAALAAALAAVRPGRGPAA